MAIVASGTSEEIKSQIIQAANEGREIILEPGVYHMNIDLVNGSRGFILRGSGRNRTFIRGVEKNLPTLMARGLWYSRIQDVRFDTYLSNEAGGVVEIDGGPSHGVQGNTYDNIAVEGLGINDGKRSLYALTICKNSGSSGQGSEQVFLNCHFYGASEACYLHHGFNALNNQFYGGNFQGYSKDGIRAVFGSFHVHGVGFQSTTGIEQIYNDGWDIRSDSGGVGDALSINGCRTESLRFFKGCGAQPPMITNCNQRISMNPWWANYNYAAGTAIYDNGLYVAKENHSSSVFNPEQWNKINFYTIDCIGAVLLNNHLQHPDIYSGSDISNPGLEIDADYSFPDHTFGPKYLFVKADKVPGQPVNVYMPNPGLFPNGAEITIVRADNSINSANVVNVHSLYFNNENRHLDVITVAKRWTTYKALGHGIAAPRRWYTLSPIQVPPPRFVS